jgi:hypothetical protein
MLTMFCASHESRRGILKHTDIEEQEIVHAALETTPNAEQRVLRHVYIAASEHLNTYWFISHIFEERG